MITSVTNNTGVEVEWGGRIYAVAETYTIEEVDRLRLASDASFISAVRSGDATVSDAVRALSVRTGLGLITLNPMVLMDYYALTQENDLLMGNGHILLLNDDYADLTP